MAIRRIFGPTEDQIIHNNLVDMLYKLDVITASQRADMLRGTLIFRPGIYSTAGFYDIGTGDYE